MISTRFMVLALLVSLIAGGLGMAGVGVKAYAAGREKEKLVQQAIMARTVERHRADLDAANARTDAVNEAWRLERQGADRAQEKERAETRAAMAAVNADRERLRDQLAAAASGGVEAADDSVAACRGRAATLGRVLGEALQAHAECTAAAEDAATGVRTLQRAWPSSAASQPAE